jgi:hypothetical protein
MAEGAGFNLLSFRAGPRMKSGARPRHAPSPKKPMSTNPLVSSRARLSMVLLVLVTAPAALAQNFLTNGDFSSVDANGDPLNWSMESAAIVSIDTADFPSGYSRSMKVDLPVGGGSSLGFVLQSLNVGTTLAANTNYAARVWVKSTASGQARVQVKRFNSSGAEIDRVDSPSSTTGWSRVQVGFDTGGGTARVEVLLRYRKDAAVTGQVAKFAGAEVLDGANSTLGTLALVETFESISVYAPVNGALVPGATGHSVELSYRPTGTTTWLLAIAPVGYMAENEFRGSVLLLQANTSYDVRAQLKNNGVAIGLPQTASITTWSDSVPIATTITLPASTTTTYSITAQGTAIGWIKYVAAGGGSTVDVGSTADYAVLLNGAKYVIVEGLTIKGGKKNSIRVSNSDHVRIRHCDISGWSEAGTFGQNTTTSSDTKWGYFTASPFTTSTLINLRGGIYVIGAGSSQVVIERNLIHHPIGKSSTWAFANGSNHPAGAEGVVLDSTGGNHVIRHNDMIAGAGHFFNDVIEGSQNSAVNGGPHKDTDIQGNLLAGANDDSVELDGGQKNVRFWHNWSEGHFVAISNASPANKGSAYVFKNIFSGADERDTSNKGLKVGGGPGVAHFVNNTLFTRNYGMIGGNSSGSVTTLFTRNNIFTGPVPGNGTLRFDDTGTPWSVLGDIDYDLVPVNGIQATNAASKEPHKIEGYPDFADAEARSFLLAPGSPGIGAGVAVPNITPAGVTNPDMGAVDVDSSASAWPLRPITPDVFPMRSVVRLRTGNSTNITLQLHAPSTTGATWIATKGETWLSLSASSGSTGAAAQTITVTVNGAGLALGTHRTFVSFRTNTGALRTALIDVEIEPASDSIFPIEAEAGTISGGFSIVADASASGGSYAHADSGGSGNIMHTFSVPAGGGIYYVHARVRADGPSSSLQTQNSFNLRIDSDLADLRWDVAGLGTDWDWDTARVVPAVVTADVTGPIAFTAGTHSIQIWKREAGVQIDTIVVSNSPYPPRVAAPVFSPPGGNYGAAQSVAITSATSGATIRYTTNGSTPMRTNGTVYSGPFNISTAATLKAIAYKDQLADSKVTADVYIFAAAFQMSSNQVVMEAEHYTTKVAAGGADWTFFTDATAVGGATDNAIRSLPNTGVGTSAPGPNVTRVDYRFNIPTGSVTTFYVHLRTRAATTTDDSVWASIDGSTTTYQQIGSSTTGYAWKSSNSSYTIPAGVHTLTIWMREDGDIVDRIVLKSSSTPPTGTGPAESPQS